MQKIFSIFRNTLIVGLLTLSQSCGTYSLSGASIPEEMKTLSVQFFENTSPLVVPYLSQQFTEGLKDRIRNQSRLSIVRSEADANFEGRITDYTIRPVAIQGNDRAGLNRVTVTVSVKYTNALQPELNFEQSFQAFQEFSLNQGPIQTQEQKLLALIIRQLTEDIFNKAFANW
ncbi:MAG: LptE family protein [Daejeonella sp.]|uniref:LptE family protein n=1 Tax=Daejeonella sp. TaxID=2805397 RepID=UPI0027326FAF|nr:LptE family protein [Daejeonella sp.]MDP3466832.1 LptE family protein [Daejeonella sp.]